MIANINHRYIKQQWPLFMKVGFTSRPIEQLPREFKIQISSMVAAYIARNLIKSGASRNLSDSLKVTTFGLFFDEARRAIEFFLLVAKSNICPDCMGFQLCCIFIQLSALYGGTTRTQRECQHIVTDFSWLQIHTKKHRRRSKSRPRIKSWKYSPAGPYQHTGQCQELENPTIPLFVKTNTGIFQPQCETSGRLNASFKCIY